MVSMSNTYTTFTPGVLRAWQSTLVNFSLDYDLHDSEGRALFRSAVTRSTRATSCSLIRELAEFHGADLNGNQSRAYLTRQLADAYITDYLREVM